MYKLSVIIPLYNTEKYIYKCIESCLNQSQSHDDYEIIVVNDGSTDDSYNIAKSFEKGDFNVQVLSQENNKQGAARNFGLKKARGEYIWFVDSDDWIEQNAIENLLSIVKKTPVDIVRFNAVDYTGSSSKLRPCKHIPNIIYNRQKILSENKFSVCFPFHIFNREFLLKNNLFFLEGVFFEDNELMIKILDKVL